MSPVTRARFAGPELIAAIIFNLVPVFGVLFWGWSAFALVFLYWTENIFIGLRIIASMLTSGLLRGGPLVAAAAAASAFFAVHYGMFCFVHGVFVVSMFGDGQVDADALNLSAAATELFAEQPNLMVGLASIALWQAVEFVLFLFREAKTASVRELMVSPYPRIVVLHVTIIFGGFLLMLTGWPLVGVVALALFKLAYDVAMSLGMSPLKIAQALRPGRET